MSKLYYSIITSFQSSVSHDPSEISLIWIINILLLYIFVETVIHFFFLNKSIIIYFIFLILRAPNF